MVHFFISIKKFAEEPYSKILGYPKATNRQIKSRIKELEKLKIKSISLTGPTSLGKLAILGKGYVGVVVLAKKNNKQVALKIRRTDSQRNNMKNESVLLKLVNSINVGPKMIDVSKNFLVMEYLEGEKISDWVNSLKGVGSTKKLKSTIKKVLEDCYRLDQIGFDHGELSSISKHVIVGKTKSTIIDFESSSTNRKPSNVTSITQAFFIGSGIAKKVQKIYKNPSKEKIIEALKQYKQEKSKENLEELLKILKLEII
ncbi:MAG: RIO1 family regulatory kinase/ATPase [Nitrosopumilus sp.]|jgi:putative serine/threonine protein kinase